MKQWEVFQGKDLTPLLDIHLVFQKERDMEYQKAEIGGTIIWFTVGYLLGYLEVKQVRISQG